MAPNGTPGSICPEPRLGTRLANQSPYPRHELSEFRIFHLRRRSRPLLVLGGQIGRIQFLNPSAILSLFAGSRAAVLFTTPFRRLSQQDYLLVQFFQRAVDFDGNLTALPPYFRENLSTSPCRRVISRFSLSRLLDV